VSLELDLRAAIALVGEAGRQGPVAKIQVEIGLLGALADLDRDPFDRAEERGLPAGTHRGGLRVPVERTGVKRVCGPIDHGDLIGPPLDLELRIDREGAAKRAPEVVPDVPREVRDLDPLRELSV
jgi:hypothetical protein